MANLWHAWRIALMALLALAVASAWSTGGSMAMSQRMARAHASADTGHAHSNATGMDAGHTAHAHSPATAVKANHDPAAAGCCVMTTCHPAVPVLPIEIAHKPSNGPPAPGRVLHPAGNEPSPALPPPRNSQV
jgi:hypothetical protein